MLCATQACVDSAGLELRTLHLRVLSANQYADAMSSYMLIE